MATRRTKPSAPPTSEPAMAIGARPLAPGEVEPSPTGFQPLSQAVQTEPTPSGEQSILSTMHGVPPLSLELGSEIETMTDDEVRSFHYFSDTSGGPDSQNPYLHMGYLPHIISQRNSLLPMVTLRIIDQLERLFSQNLALLSIVKRNFAWRLKVETTG